MEIQKKENIFPIEPSIDVLCAGMATYDLFFEVEKHPLPDDKVFASAFLGCGGGPAANAAVTIAKLGGKSALAGYLGNDLFGDIHFRELETAGVLTNYIVRGLYPTRIATIIVKPDGSRTVVSFKGTVPGLTTQELNIDIRTFRPAALLCDGHEPGISLCLADQARVAGIPVVLDAGSVHQGTVALLPYTDYLVCSRKFAFSFCPVKSMKQIPDYLQQYCRNVIITLGADGVVWKSENNPSRKLPAYKVNVVDTTGAGDVFHGAFTLGITRALPLEDAIRFASAAAALACTKLGARPGCPDKSELESFFKNHSPG